MSLCVCLRFAMASHLAPVELDVIFRLGSQGKPPAEVHAALSRKRSRQGLQAPTLKRIRGALRGTTYRRSRKETRGRKRKLTRKAVLKMNTTRKRLIKKALRLLSTVISFIIVWVSVGTVGTV